MAERKSVPLRIHPRLYEALRRWAEDDFRSVNGQIEWLCHQALQRVGRLPQAISAEGPGGTDPATADLGETPETEDDATDPDEK